MDKVILGAILIIGFIGLVLIFGALAAYPTMLLWNWLIPSIFELREINFWEAWGLLALTGLLFKSVSTSSSSK